MDLFSKTTFIHAVFCLHRKPVLAITGNCKDSSVRATGLHTISRSHGPTVIGGCVKLSYTMESEQYTVLNGLLI